MDTKTMELLEQLERNSRKQSFEVVQERSTPVQSRVDLMTLAELDVFWMKEGYNIRTMSQLVSWSIELVKKILIDNGKLPTQFETLAEAHRYLNLRGLYQSSLKRKGAEKLRMAVAFEGLREQGIDPRAEAPEIYRKLHNEGSVQPLNVEVNSQPKITEEEYQRARLENQRQRYEERQEQKRIELERAKASGLIVDDPRPKVIVDQTKTESPKPGEGFREGISDKELDEYNAKREAERIALENAPVDMDYLMKNVVKPK